MSLNDLIPGKQKRHVSTDSRSSDRSQQVGPDAEELSQRRSLPRQDADGSTQILSVGRNKTCPL